MSEHPYAYVDPNTMKSAVGREAAIRLNEEIVSSNTRIDRLLYVVDEFFFFNRDFQLDLAEAAIIWALASLAGHDGQRKCKLNFYTLVEITYTSTGDAERTLSESQREEIVTSAASAQEQLIPQIEEVLRDSIRDTITSNDEELKTTAECLWHLRTTFLEFAPSKALCDLLIQCVLLGTEIEKYARGVGADNAMRNSVLAVFNCAMSISNTVLQSIKDGRLVVDNSRIVDPEGLE